MELLFLSKYPSRGDPYERTILPGLRVMLVSMKLLVAIEIHCVHEEPAGDRRPFIWRNGNNNDNKSPLN